MRAILIDPFARKITELSLPATGDFMGNLAELIVADALMLDAVPPHTAMFLDAIGFLRERQAYWRHVDYPIERNSAGRAVVFGLTPEGKLADLPATVTVQTLAERIVWTDDMIERRVERLQIVQTPEGPVPMVHRTVMWKAGAVHPANGEKPAPAPAGGDPLASMYLDGAGGPVSPPAAVPAPAIKALPLWAIHETPDGRYKVMEYEVTDAGGLGDPLSLATVPNLETARQRIPAGMKRLEADEDTADDTLVETWF